MSDQLTVRGALRVALVQAVVIVLVFAAVGALCGLLWEAVWSPAPGAVLKHEWYPISWYAWQETIFAASAWYVVIGTVAGLVLGALGAWRLDGAELVTLAAVIVGGLVGALLMRTVGLHRGPGDPQVAAQTARDGARLPSELHAPSRWLLLAFPGGALASLGVLYLTVTKRGRRDAVQPLPTAESSR